jgi:hypothetical protein
MIDTLKYKNALSFMFIFACMVSAISTMEVISVEHFMSSHHLFEHAYFNHFRFGIDLIDNVGPFGFLHYPNTYSGQAYWSKILWYSGLCGLYAYFAVRMASQFNTLTSKLLFIIAVTLFPLQIQFPWFAFEVLPRIVILFATLYFLSDIYSSDSRKTQLIHLLLVSIVYALLSLEKASNIHYISALTIILSTYWLTQKKWGTALGFIGLYCGSLLVFWHLAHQNISDLYAYLISIQSFIQAYNVLVLDMPNTLLSPAIIYVVLCIILILARMVFLLSTLAKPRYSSTVFLQEMFRNIAITTLIFLSWKHGMMRGLASYGTFFNSITIIITLLFLYPVGKEHTRKLKTRICELGCGLFIITAWLTIHQTYPMYNLLPQEEYAHRLHSLRKIKLFQRHNKLQTEYHNLVNNYRLPSSLQTLFLTHRVDEFGSIPEVLLLNKVNYKPRPATMDIIAANTILIEKNASYYQNPDSAPEFVLLSKFGFHNTDTEAYLQLLLNFHLRETYKDWFVMERNSQWLSIKPVPLIENDVALGQWISVDESQKNPIWSQINAQYSLIGYLKAIIYKPTLLTIEFIQDDDTYHQYDMSLDILKIGFLLNPTLKIEEKFKSQDGTKSCSKIMVKAFRVTLKHPEDKNLFKPSTHIKLSTMKIKGILSKDNKIRHSYEKCTLGV